MWDVYVNGNPEVAWAAFNSLAMLFGNGSFGIAGSITKIGLLFALVIILAQGVNAKAGLRLDLMLIQLLIVYALFLPKTSVLVIGDDHGAPRIADDVPLIAAVPPSVASTISNVILDAVYDAFSTASINPGQLTIDELRDKPAMRYVGKLLRCGSSPFNCSDPNLDYTIEAATKWCGGYKTANARFASSQNVLMDFADTLNDAGQSVIYDAQHPYRPDGASGRQASCTEVKNHLRSIAQEVSGSLVSADVINMFSSVTTDHENLADVEEAITRLFSGLIEFNTIDAMNITLYSLVNQMQKTGDKRVGSQLQLTADQSLFDAAMETSLTARGMALVGETMGQALFVVFIVSTPLVMFMVVANPLSGPRIVGSYVIAAFFAQAEDVFELMVNFWYLIRIHSFDLPPGEFTSSGIVPSVENVARLFQHAIETTAATGNILEIVPVLTFAMLSGSIFAFVRAIGSVNATPDSADQFGGSAFIGKQLLTKPGAAASYAHAKQAASGYAPFSPKGVGAKNVMPGLSVNINSMSGFSQSQDFLEKASMSANAAMGQAAGQLFQPSPALSLSSEGTTSRSSGTSEQGSIEDASTLRDSSTLGRTQTKEREAETETRGTTEGSARADVQAALQASGRLGKDTQHIAEAAMSGGGLSGDELKSAEGIRDTASRLSKLSDAAMGSAGDLSKVQQVRDTQADLARKVEGHGARFGNRKGSFMEKLHKMLPAIGVSGAIEGSGHIRRGVSGAVSSKEEEDAKVRTSLKQSDQAEQQDKDYQRTGASTATRHETSDGFRRMREKAERFGERYSKASEARQALDVAKTVSASISSGSTMSIPGDQLANQRTDTMAHRSGDDGTALGQIVNQVGSMFGGNGDALQKFQAATQQTAQQWRDSGRGRGVGSDKLVTLAAIQTLGGMMANGDLETRMQSFAAVAKMAEDAGMSTGLGVSAAQLSSAARALPEGLGQVQGQVNAAMSGQFDGGQPWQGGSVGRYGAMPEGGSAVIMANGGATRNQPITQQLENRVHEAVRAVFGANAKAQLYSGGQQPGEGVGSNRHDNGRAGDFHIFGNDGQQIKGDELGKLGQYWLANNYGSVGMEMGGGGIHLDTLTKDQLGAGQGLAWGYEGKGGGQYTAGQREAVQAGLRGEMPDLAMSPQVAAQPIGGGSSDVPGGNLAPNPAGSGAVAGVDSFRSEVAAVQGANDAVLASRQEAAYQPDRVDSADTQNRQAVSEQADHHNLDSVAGTLNGDGLLSRANDQTQQIPAIPTPDNVGQMVSFKPGVLDGDAGGEAPSNPGPPSPAPEQQTQTPAQPTGDEQASTMPASNANALYTAQQTDSTSPYHA